MAQGSSHNTQDGNQARSAPVSDAPADHIGHRWTRDHEENGGSGNKQK